MNITSAGHSDYGITTPAEHSAISLALITNLFFSIYEEFDGTIKIIDLIEILLNKNNEKIYVIDEIDRCLHPQLTYKFIETYL